MPLKTKLNEFKLDHDQAMFSFPLKPDRDSFTVFQPSNEELNQVNLLWASLSQLPPKSPMHLHLLLALTLFACAPGHSPVQSPPVAVPERMDTLPMIPEEVVQAEHRATGSMRSYASLQTNKFPFANWLTRITSQDSIQGLNTQVDSLMRGPFCSADSAALSGEWHLACFLSQGWVQVGPDKTEISRHYRADTSPFRLRGTDLTDIFRATDGWTATLLGEHVLVMQLWHFYPNGNQTSWEFRHLYIFEK